MPFDPKTSKTMKRLRQNMPANGLPVQNGGGIAEPTSAATPQPHVPEKVIPRSRQDSIQRPVMSPSTAGTPGGGQGLQPPGEDRMAFRDRIRNAAAAGMPPATAVGDAAPATNAEQLEQKTDRAELELVRQETIQDTKLGEAQATAGQETTMLSEAAKSGDLTTEQAVKDMRAAQPSAVEGIPQGTYDKVVNAKVPSNLSPEQGKKYREDAEKQLRDFGDYPGRSDPKAPAPPIRPGKRSYNPFTGRFTGGQGEDIFTAMGIDFEGYVNEYKTRAKQGLPLPPAGGSNA